MDERLIESLISEFSQKTSEELIVAYRGNHRWAQTFEPAHLVGEDEGETRLRESGVYLITGGLGGIGLALAEHLARTVRAKLILTGRSAVPGREEWKQWLETHDDQDRFSLTIRKLQEIENLGADVLALSADVSDLEQMHAVRDQAHKRFGGINGVIHAAGIAGGGLIQLKTPESAASVLAPKVKGTLTLHEVFKDENLDFLALCSSLSSIMGVMGRVDYTAANAFLDAFAHYNTLRGGAYTVSINWDAWREVGMAADAFEKLAGSRDIARTQNKDISHPLFDQCIADGSDQEVFLTHFNVSKHWLLNEHRIMGTATLPGTAYLEMVKAALETHARTDTLEFRKVYLLLPLTVGEDEEKEVRTILKKHNDGFLFSIISRSGSREDKWQEHARGEIAYIKEVALEKHEIREIEARCNEREIVITDEDYKQKEGLIKFGSRWNNVKRVKLGLNQGLAVLELPETCIADIKSYDLHPALMDSATGFLAVKYEGAYLPFSYERLRINGPLPEKVYSYARYADNGQPPNGTLKLDITIMDDQGKILVEIEEYTLRKVDPAAMAGRFSSSRENAQPQNKINLDPQSEITSSNTENQNYSLEVSSPGILNSMTFRPSTRQAPGPGEVEVEVYATGLNFKDVLKALGMLPAQSEAPLQFGMECAGRIVRLGDGVEGFEVGDEVIAIGSSCFSSFITTSASLIARKPDNINSEEAATIPIAFLTACYALLKLGGLS
ncbi:MAG: SDR family NAD(P)-dependent oxidoreductase, partial [Nitrospira sp.]|nr:SDR family NAD(P)-dependent oxidoreductase [Nitrospira sp.]